MESFIKHLSTIINDLPEKGNELCVVFPNRRAGLFLKRNLVQPDGTPVWAPDILSIEDFTFMVSALDEPDNVTLLANLYKAHCSIGNNTVIFDRFLSWGTEILRDFEEVDQYMVDPRELFGYLRDAKQIESWQPGEELTDLQQNYIAFYESLSEHYFKLKDALLGKKLAYQGLAGRQIAENTEMYLGSLPWKKILFAGFNALTTSQLVIIKHLVKKGIARVIWDTDAYYMDDERQEAGLFLRKYRLDKELGEFNTVPGNFTNIDRSIYTCGIPGKVGQARVAGSIINRLPLESHHDTAIVLADESLLLPVLNSLPEHLDKFNVTMGFPLAQAPLYSLIDGIFQLHVHALNGASASPSFYHHDVISILQNNYLHKVIDPFIANTLVDKIKKNNFSFISFREMEGLSGTGQIDPIKPIFGSVLGTTHLLALVSKTIELIKHELSSDETSTADNEILFSLYQKVNGLITCLEREDIQIESLVTLYSFFREIAVGTRVPFYGEPLQGIQIMGMLETRVLDFENVILISANEDTLPSAKSNKSFIPFDVRKIFKLPTHTERQAVFAYHFYRLLQRSKATWLVYNEDESTLGGGEKSRFVQQLEWELPSKGIKVERLDVSQLNETGTPPLFIEIKKTPEIIEKLEEKALKGLSFSALTKYINCPLSYYFTYILGIQETEEVEEEITMRTMGSMIHEVLEDLYTGSIGKIPDVVMLRKAAADSELLIVNKTRQLYPAIKIDSGKNLLFIKVAQTWLRRFLEGEITLVQSNEAPVIKGIEHQLQRSMEVEVNGVIKQVLLYGKLDRIDVSNGQLRVIDYKTGKVDESELKVRDIEDMFGQTKFEKKLQLSIYRYIVKGDAELNQFEIKPGIISFKALNKGFMSLESSVDDDQFEQRLKDLIAELLNPEINFTQAETKNCKYCNFIQICHRNIKNGF